MKPRLLGPLAAAILSALILADSCNFDDPFPQYQGVNLIEGMGFEQSDLTAAGATTPGVWTWAWKESEGDSFDYMKLEPEGTGPSGGVAYELSLENLYADDGTFATAPGPGWFAGSGSSVSVITEPEAAAIHGNTLKLVSVGNSYVGLNPSLLFRNLTTQGHNFNLVMLASGGGPYRASTVADYKPEAPTGTLPADTDDFRLGETFLGNISAASSTPILFGSSLEQMVYLDEIRCVRSDLRPALRLLLRRTDSKLPLVAGHYEFRFLVKWLSSTRLPENPGTDPYRARIIHATVNQYRSSTDYSTRASQTVSCVDAAVTLDTWIPIRVRGENIDIIEVSDDTPLLELAIYPTDPDNPDAGSILIADPVLEYFSKGY